MNWENSFESSFLTSLQNINTNLMVLFEEWKNTGTRRFSQLTRTRSVAETFIVSFSTSLSVVAVLWCLASILHHRGVHSSVLTEEFMACRDKRQKDSRKWQKGKINLVVPSDLHGLQSASRYPMQSVDAQMWAHTASLPPPCGWLCHATCAQTTGRYFLFLGLLEGGEWGVEKEAAVWMQGPRCSVRHLPHNDCLAVPSPGQGRLLVTD